MKRVALIELSESHGECIYSQILFLHPEVSSLHLILHEKQADQTNFRFENINRFFINTGDTLKQRLLAYFKIRKYLLNNKIDTVIFNTATGRIIQELLFVLPGKLRYFGTIHDGRKLVKSSTQKSITKRIKKYFVLNDFIKRYLTEKGINDKPIETYYPVYFPPLPFEKLDKGAGDFWIIVPGKVEQKRRNYLSLINQLKSNPLPPQIKFILLGPSRHFNGDGKIIEEELNKYNLGENFVLFEEYISNKTYFSYINKANLIMPLVEPGNEFFNTYKYSQITGAYNIAFGFGIPLLFHEDLNHIEDLDRFGIEYNESTLIESIRFLFDNPDLSLNISKAITSEKKFQLEYQSAKYLNFIK